MTAPARGRRWAVPLAWMAVILALSGEAFSSCSTLALVEALLRVMPAEAVVSPAGVNARARTAAHVVEYAVLAALWVHVLAGTRRRVGRAAVLTLAICLAWAAVDEVRQAREPARRGALTDVALDGAGALLGIAAWLASTRRRAT